MSDDWDEDVPPKPVAKPFYGGGAKKNAQNDDDWDDEPQPSTSTYRAPSNGYGSSRPAPKPVNNDDDWDDGPSAPSTNGHHASTNGYSSNSNSQRRPPAQSNDDDWDDDPQPSTSNGHGNNRNNNSGWGNKSSHSNTNGWSGDKTNNDDDGWNDKTNNDDDGWNDEPSGNTNNNGKRNNPFSASDDWNDEAPKTKSARCDWNGAGSSNDRRPRKSDWICDSCGAKCFGSRDTCFKCQAEKGNSKDAPDDGGTGNRGGRKPDWICDSCGAKVFGSRSNCFKCQADKGNSKDAPDDGGNGNRGGRKPDWICDSCGAKVFGSKSTCFKCQADKGNSKDAPDDGGNGNRGQRKSDWICESCGAKVYGSKTSCFKCHADKGNSRDAPSDDGGNRNHRENGNSSSRQDNGNWGDEETPSTSNGTRGKRSGDWDCTCGHNNFASRDKCQKCNEAKPEGAGATNGEDGAKVFYIPEEVKVDDLFSTGISTGINFDKYSKIPIEIVDTARNNVPSPIESFESSGLNELILSNIKRSSYSKPTPIQRHAIPIICAGRDLMACAQTGSGKTAAFLLPIIQTLMAENIAPSIGSPNVLVVTPTRELTTQIFNEARKYAQGSAIKVCQIYGGTASRHQMQLLNSGCHILVATMGRLLDYCRKSLVEFDKLRFLVFDEADRMLEHGFLPDIETMMSHPTMENNKGRQTVMFSATFPDDMCHMAGQYLKEQVFLKVGMIGGACGDVEQTFIKIGQFQKRGKLQEILAQEDGQILVFVEQKKTADFMASFLCENKIKSTSIHGNRLQPQREEALGDFKSGRRRVLLATAVAARGLDIPNVKLVINFDLPKTIDEYVHRIGRTGRVGNIGKSISFFDPERQQDQNLERDLKKVLKNANQPIPDFLESGGGNDDDDNIGASATVTNSADPPAHGGGGDDEEW